jgi:hypothetical protein
MDELRLPAVAARVVAWHNRNPLARRISAAQVRSVGYVALRLAGDGAAEPFPAPAPLPAASADGPLAAAVPGWVPDPPPGEPPPAPLAAPAAAQDVDEAAALAALAEMAEPAASAHTTAPAVLDPAAGFEVELDLRADDGPPAGAVEAADSAGGAPIATVAPPVDPPPADPPTLTDEWSGPDRGPQPADTGAATAVQLPVWATAAGPSAARTLRASGSSLRDRLLGRGPAAAPAGVQGGLLTDHLAGRPADPARAFEHRQGDHFMAPLSPRAVARWVARHGRALLAAPQDGPVHAVSTARVAGGPQGGTTYVMTAAIDVGGLRSRVLVGAGPRAAVLGARLLSGPRVAAATVLVLALLLVLVAATWVLRWPAAAAAGSETGAAVAAPPASAAAPASAPAAAASGAADSAADAPAGSHPDSPADAQPDPPADAQADPHAAAATESPVPAEADPHATAAPAPELRLTTVKPPTAYAQKGRIALPGRGASLNDEDKAAARAAVEAARAQVGRAPVTAPAAPAPDPQAAEPARSPTPAAKTAPVGPAFALSTRTLRTRAEAEQVQAAMAALLRAGGSPVRLELLPEGEDWRVVAWPFADPASAEQARALLASRGMKVSVVGL